jgi:hypothetical protein
VWSSWLDVTGGVFDIRDDVAFFSVVTNTLSSYRSSNAKAPEQLLLLVLGLSHLREWIAPGYRRGAVATNTAECFVARLFEYPDYQTIHLLANHAKHQRRIALPETQVTTCVEMIDDRDIPIDSWIDFDAGPASAYHYGDRDLGEIFENVVTFYRDNWFNLSIQQRLACLPND